MCFVAGIEVSNIHDVNLLFDFIQQALYIGKLFPKVRMMSDVLVVGGAGYIGSHVVLELLENNKNVIVLDDLSTGSKDAVLGGTFYKGCMSDKRLLDEIFDNHNVSIVMLLAGSIDVKESVDNPLKYYTNNISKTLILLEQMLKHNVMQIIFSSTASICGEELGKITLESKASPQNPYARTKYMIEQILKDFDKAYDLKNIILRYFNAAGADPKGRIGYHEPITHLIPLALKTASGKKEYLSINGYDYPTKDGTCVRDYIHVMDLASAHILALDYLNNKQESSIFNLGNGKGYSVQEVIEVAKTVTNVNFNTKLMPRREGDPAYMVADSSVAKKVLNWRPKYNTLENIIEDSWKWENIIS